MHLHEPLAVRVWGEFACFTRPEMKVERVSYPVVNPSAARGILEAIFWKPEFTWRIQRVAVLTPIRHFSVLRNEVSSKVAPRTVAGWMRGDAVDPYCADDDRAQRSTLGLRDVAYRIEAQVQLREGRPGCDEMKYREQFMRRVSRGQCHTRPALGCREFAAHFCEADLTEAPHATTDELGLMLFDVRYDAAGRGTPVFFHARLEDGVLEVPQGLYAEVGP
jgi:CRISPR-associated protein Cas5d